jgi:uncharacterized membrane protein YccC
MTRKEQLQEAFKLALSMMLFYWLALWMNWDLPKFGALAIVVVSLSTTGASLNKGVMRVAGTGLGALAGFVLLSWFSQSPQGMLLGVSLYLAGIGYIMQTSRQGDIWFNAGLIAVAVWSSSYMQVDTAFHFAMARFLETAAGVIIFTLVSMLLWPRTSRQSLQQQGQALWEDMQALFGTYRRQLAPDTNPGAATELRTRLAGTLQQLQGTLESAYADTPAIRRQKRGWELLRVDLQAFGRTLELWQESIADCRQLEPGKRVPGLEQALDTMQQRLARGRTLWETQALHDNNRETGDTALLTELDLDIDSRASADLTRLQHAALTNFTVQLGALDRTSRELLQTLRVLAGLDPADKLHSHAGKAAPFRPARWNPERLLKAVFPALCWITAYVFWIVVQPPGGPAVTMIAAAFGLIMLLAPLNLLGLLLVLLLSMFIVVLPVYLFIMPLLDSGFAILSLIFLYTFCFAWLGGRSPVLKIGPLMMFVMVANITNNQGYSFIGMVTAGLLMLIGVSIVVLVHRLLSPMHPEKILLRSLQRFFRGCGGVVSSYTLLAPRQQARARRQRKRLFETRVLPLPLQMQAAANNLDHELFPDNTEDKVRHLLDCLYSLRARLQALDMTFDRTAGESAGLLQDIHPLHGEWGRRIPAVFRQWARLRPADSLIHAWRDQPELARDLEQRLVELQNTRAAGEFDAAGLQNLYALTGSIKGLLEAMEALQASLQQINWNQWAVARF